MGQVRTDHNGNRIRHIASKRVFLVDEGKLRYIPHPDTLTTILRNWDGIIDVPNLDEWVEGRDIRRDAKLEQGTPSGKVYLIDQPERDGEWKKRYISSPAVMDKYHFRWPGHKTADATLDGIPDGNTISS